VSKYAKHPFPGTRGHLEATTDEATIRRWIKTRPGCNWATAMRPGDVGVDIDPRKGGEETWAELSKGKPWVSSPTILTGSDGLHKYFRGDVLRQGTDALGPGVDIKAYIAGPPERTGYLIIAGSRTPTGTYHVLNGGFDDPPELPLWLHPKPQEKTKPKTTVGAALHGTDYALAALRDEVSQAGALRDGQGRRNFLFGAARRLGKKFVPPFSESDIVTALVAAGMKAGLTEDEAEPHVRNGLATGLGQR
jgi:hypothetical protein